MDIETLSAKAEPVHYAKWRKVMQDYEASGLTQIEYCAREDHLFRQFKYYRSRFSQLSKNKTNTPLIPVAFAPIKLSSPASAGLRIELGAGVYCIMRNPSDVVLVKALLSGLR